MVKAKEAKEALSKFAKKIAGIINRAIEEACSKENWTFREDIEDITEKDLLKIWDKGQFIKDGGFSLIKLQNFSDKDLEDLTRYFKDEGESDECLEKDEDEPEKYLEKVIKQSTGIGKDHKDHKEIYGKIMAEIADELNNEWRNDFNLNEYDELDEREIIAFYFLHSFENQMERVTINPVKEADDSSPAGKQKELDQLLDEHNFVLIQSRPTQPALWGKEFLKWFCRQEGRSYTIIDWKKEMKDLKMILAAVPSRERKIMEELGFEMNFYGEGNSDDEYFTNSAENIQECFKSICFPDKFILIIDGYDGSSSLLEDLHMFAVENGGKNRFKIIILPLNHCDEVVPTFHIGQLDGSCLRRIFEDYAGISLKKEEETAGLVDQLCENVSDNPEMMVLFGEAFKKQMEKKDIEFADKLLKHYLGLLDKEEENKEKDNKEKGEIDEYEFHSRLHRPEMKLSGHIKSVYEKYIPLNKGPLVVLSCVRNIPIPEELACSWFAINSNDLKEMQSIGWCKKNGNKITISVPLTLTKALVSNEEDRKQATDALDKFLHRIEREIRDAKPYPIDAKMLNDIMKQIWDFPNSWLTKIVKKDINQYKEKIRMFKIYCISHAYQCGDFEYAKELIKFKGDETFSNSVAGKIWLRIIDLHELTGDTFNAFDKDWRAFENQYLIPLKENKDAALEALSDEELFSYIEMIREYLEITLGVLMLHCLAYGPEIIVKYYEIFHMAYTYADLKELLEAEENARNDHGHQENDLFKPMTKILMDYCILRIMSGQVEMIDDLRKQQAELIDDLQIQHDQIKMVMDRYLLTERELPRREKIEKVNLYCDVWFILYPFSQWGYLKRDSVVVFGSNSNPAGMDIKKAMEEGLCRISEASEQCKGFLSDITLSKIDLVKDLYKKICRRLSLLF